MLNINDIMETINMISEENLDIRTITMGISLLDCLSESVDATAEKIYDKITKKADVKSVFLLGVWGFPQEYILSGRGKLTSKLLTTC